MRAKDFSMVVLALGVFGAWAGISEAAIGTKFTYQGQLAEDPGGPITDSCNFEFKLWTALTGGSQVDGTKLKNGVGVENGVFAVELDFGSGMFVGNKRWLAIRVCCPSSGCSLETLNPRVEMTPAPYSLYSPIAPWSGLTGVPAGFADNTDNTMTLPYSGSVSTNGPALSVTNSSTGSSAAGVVGRISNASAASFSAAVRADADGNNGIGLWATQAGSGFGVYATTQTGIGVYGRHEATTGTSAGVAGTTDSTATNAAGVKGQALAASGSTIGVYGYNQSTSGKAVYGQATKTTGTTYGLYGEVASTSGRAVRGEATANSGGTYGGYFTTTSTFGTGAYAYASSGTGATTGSYGRTQSTDANAEGVYGYAASSTGSGTGVYGRSYSQFGNGVKGIASSSIADSVHYGGWFQASGNSGVGVHGEHTSTSGVNPGVSGDTDSTQSYANGVRGDVNSTSPGGYSAAVRGHNRGTGGNGIGVYGSHNGLGWGVYGTSNGGTAIFGENKGASGTAIYGLQGAGTYAGYFAGRVHVSGNLSASGTKPFMIDHPLDPENKYLYHYALESPEVLNVYRGTLVLDANGEGWADLPSYFHSINRDFDYQLTAVGAAMPNLHIAREIADNTFQISGGQPHERVSWLVMSARNDAYMRKHRETDEVAKSVEERGKYLNPELLGKPKELGIDYLITRQVVTAEAVEHMEREAPQRVPEIVLEELDYIDADMYPSEEGVETAATTSIDAQMIERELAALRDQMEARIATLERLLEQLDQIEGEEE